MLTIGSLFAGIGGFDLGFERAGFKTVWQVEINEYCRKVLARHFPDAKRYSDILNCCGLNCTDPGRWRDGDAPCFRDHLRPVDVICGGFPCQDISNAGLRAGIDGERSGLWREMHRVIGELRPRYVVVENVAALLGRGISRVLGDLAEIGYDAEWDCISAANVGAPHLRERIWIVAYANLTDGEAWNADRLGAREQAATPPRHGCTLANANISGLEGWQREELRQCASERAAGPGYSLADATCELSHRSRIWAEQAGRRELADESWWSVEPNVGRVAHGVPARVDRLRALGNSVVPQIPELIARRLKEVLVAER